MATVRDRWTNLRFNRLLVTDAWVEGIVTKLRCICDCGEELTVRAADAKSGNTGSCGCLRVENAIAMRTTHGMTYSNEYEIWSDMKKRCTNKKHNRYDRYGGRGISVCAKWAEDFTTFYADMGPRPSKDHQIDRINNDGNYEPQNCRWATRRENMLNTGRAMFAEYQGKNVCLKDLAILTGVKYGTLYYRYKRGLPVVA
jgi:hypothetical protein